MNACWITIVNFPFKVKHDKTINSEFNMRELKLSNHLGELWKHVELALGRMGWTECHVINSGDF